MIGIIFDCDGTLIDSEHAYYLSWQAALQARGGSISLEEYSTLAGYSGMHVAQKLHEKVNADSAEALLQDTKKAFREIHTNAVKPIERTVKFVRALAQQKQKLNIKMGVASAAGKQEILLNLGRTGLTEVFDVIVSGRDDLQHYQDPEGVNKPKPYIYLHTAQLLGLLPSSCVAFEDSGPGVLAATRAGILTYAVPHPLTKDHDFSEAHCVIQPDTELDIQEFFASMSKLLKKPSI
ncbi:MAG: HAD family phosphatase [Verrucomicrobia bacterium]|nr:HAD family phosphatase [Verrucomicrobiota bacterium]